MLYIRLPGPASSSLSAAAAVVEAVAGDAASSSTVGAAAVRALSTVGAGGGSRASGPKVYSTPEILASLEPCQAFKIGLNNTDHRFFVSTKRHSERFIPPYDKKTFSKSFVNYPWQESLCDVHRHCWEKFNLTEWPLENARRQNPGEVPEDVLRHLEDVVKKMPKPKIYHKSL